MYMLILLLYIGYEMAKGSKVGGWVRHYGPPDIGFPYENRWEMQNEEDWKSVALYS